jgi:hypothetical protein
VGRRGGEGRPGERCRAMLARSVYFRSARRAWGWMAAAQGLLGRAGTDGEELAAGSAWVGAGSLRVVTTGSAAGGWASSVHSICSGCLAGVGKEVGG